MATAASVSSKRVHYAWIAAAVTFLTLLVAAGGRATPGVLIVPLCNEFQWSRATVSSIISVNIFLYGLVGPFAAALYERFGLRKTMCAALVLVGGGYALSTRATNYWEFLLLWGVVVGLGSGMAATVLGAAVANRWFSEKRGLVMGLLTASTATGQLIFLRPLARATTDSGWRSAPMIVAVSALVVVPLVGWLMRDTPAQIGLKPFGANDDEEPEAKVTGNPATLALRVLGEATGSRDFWFLAGSFFVCGASTNGLIGTHLVSAAYDCGIPEVAAASLLTLMGVCDLFGTSFSGWLSDRIDGRYLLCGYYGFRGLSLLFLPVALSGPGWMRIVFAVFYGLDWIATVPPTVRLARDSFGLAKSGIVFGWVVAAHQLGAAAATYGAGWVRTAFGHYEPAFYSSGALCVVVAFGMLTFGRKSPDRASPALTAA